MTTVGVLGIGRMGSAMARALARAGFDVVLWNRTPEAARALAAEIGGTAVERPRDVAAAADVTVSMLANGDAVDAVYGGPDGLIAGAHPGTVFCDASTVAPATFRAHDAAARAAGAGLLDAPVSGSVGLAETGKLTIMVGGETERPRAGPAGPRGARGDDLPPRSARHRGRDEARGQHADLRAQPGARRGADPGDGRRHRAGVRLRRARRRAPPVRRYVGYKRAAFLEPDATPVAFSLDLAAKDLRPHRRARRRGRRRDAAAPPPTSPSSTRPSPPADGDRDFSAVTTQLRTQAGSSARSRGGAS